VYSLAEQNRFYKKAAAFCLRAVAKHSPELAQAVIDSGALDSLVTCLEEFDPGVKEAAAWTLGYIAGHNAELAQQVVDAGGVPLLVLCVQVRGSCLITTGLGLSHRTELYSHHSRTLCGPHASEAVFIVGFCPEAPYVLLCSA
jgi:hypothetical protein